MSCCTRVRALTNPRVTARACRPCSSARRTRRLWWRAASATCCWGSPGSRCRTRRPPSSRTATSSGVSGQSGQSTGSYPSSLSSRTPTLRPGGRVARSLARPAPRPGPPRPLAPPPGSSALSGEETGSATLPSRGAATATSSPPLGPWQRPVPRSGRDAGPSGRPGEALSPRPSCCRVPPPRLGRLSIPRSLKCYAAALVLGACEEPDRLYRAARLRAGPDVAYPPGATHATPARLPTLNRASRCCSHLPEGGGTLPPG